jgi:hypothetical protein
MVMMMMMMMMIVILSSKSPLDINAVRYLAREGKYGLRSYIKVTPVLVGIRTPLDCFLPQGVR